MYFMVPLLFVPLIYMKDLAFFRTMAIPTALGIERPGEPPVQAMIGYIIRLFRSDPEYIRFGDLRQKKSAVGSGQSAVSTASFPEFQ
jgi:hypothetical protein